MSTSAYVEAQNLARLAGLQFAEEMTSAGRVYLIKRDREVLHQTSDLDDVHGWLKAWLEYVQ